MAEEKARSKLDKAKAFLEEAKALVTVYVVTTTSQLPYTCMWREYKNCACTITRFLFTAIEGGGSTLVP